MISRNITEWINLNKINQIKEQFDNLKNIHYEIDSVTLFGESRNYIYSTYNNSENQKVSNILNTMLDNYLLTDMDDVFIYEDIGKNETKIYILNKTYSKDIHYILIEVNFENIKLLL